MTNFSVPFSLTPGGSVQVTSDPNQVANDRVESLIGTYPGERVMLPDYGVPLPPDVFSPNIAALETTIVRDIQQAMNQWEPSVVLDTVTPVLNQSDVGIVSVNVEFSLSNNVTLTPVQVVTVLVGGTVIQN
jgi:phage baseplate assembly protein W